MEEIIEMNHFEDVIYAGIAVVVEIAGCLKNKFHIFPLIYLVPYLRRLNSAYICSKLRSLVSGTSFQMNMKNISCNAANNKNT